MPEPTDPSDDCLVDVHAPEVPASVRQAVLALQQPCDQLWRCPRLGAPRGLPGAVLGAGPHSVVIEWWLLDAQGELIEAFWEA